jgi:hypothetical protein
MITKFVLIVWIGLGQSEILSTDTFDTLAECEAVAEVLKTEMGRDGWYVCKPYTFDGESE